MEEETNMARNTKKLFSILLVVLMALSFAPMALANTISDAVYEAAYMKAGDDFWSEIEKVEADAMNRKATPAATVNAVYDFV